MAETGPASLVGEVTDFLTALRKEFPELAPTPPPRPSPTRGEGELPPGGEGELPMIGEGERHSRETAAALIKARIGHWAAVMGLGYGRVFVKSQRTLWGSCSARGNLNFNWRLAFAPRQVLDYVVIHELAHLRELNHSKRFWAMVEKYCPDFRAPPTPTLPHKGGGRTARRRAAGGITSGRVL
ncbi:MAG: M48 family metallopeptidase [Elusimicrobia bacterium]|nr:M48 family metallopeptidase [Elusimicrobiota bacterium]